VAVYGGRGIFRREPLEQVGPWQVLRVRRP
jgi:hypothetical protein